MAEARSIAFVRADLNRHSQVKIVNDASGFTLTIHVPPLPLVVRAIRRFGHEKKNLVLNAIYPLGLSVYLAICAVLAGLVIRSERDHWLRDGWIANRVWAIMLWFPYFTAWPLTAQLFFSALFAATAGFIVIVTVQRYLLRLLLYYTGWLYNPNPKASLVVKVWGIAVKILAGRNPMLYSYRGSLPRLPVPNLTATVHKYVKFAEALQTPEQLAKTKAAAAAFLANEGPTLQRYLVLKSWISANYISDWWEQYVYLRGRSPIMINSNYYVLDYAEDWPMATQAARAGHVTFEMARYARMIDHQTLPPLLIQDLVPLCMSQVERMFSTTRVPGLETDTLVHTTSNHIVAVCRGHYYQISLVQDTAASILCTPRQLEEAFSIVLADAAKRPINATSRHLPAGTADNRSLWATTRTEHFEGGVNYASLSVIESATFVVFLSEERPATWTEQGRALLMGDGSSIWFDKSVNLVVFANGKAGLNCEHSWGDATAIGHMWEWCGLTAEFMADGIGYDKNGSANLLPGEKASAGPKPSYLEWEWSPAAELAIAKHAESTAAAVQDLDLVVMCHSAYGKGFMKKCNMSPDSFIQMALQLAYYRDAGVFVNTYEAAMTRRYRNGRTETVRSCTTESVAFCRAMEDRSVPREEVIELMREATVDHNLQNKDAMCGKGIDRHLFGLYVVSVGKKIESDFLKSALSAPWTLSTSQQPQNYTNRVNFMIPERKNMHSPGGGFGPVADDGYGVSYMIVKEDKIYFHVSSKRSSPKTDSQRFADNICKAFADIASLFKK